MYVILIVITGGTLVGAMGCSVHGVRVSDRWRGGGRWGRRRRGRGADVPGKIPGLAAEIHRHVLRVGLRMAVAQVPTGARVHRLWPVCRTLHHAVHRRQHAVHGTRPPRNGSKIGLCAQQSQRREYIFTDNTTCLLFTLDVRTFQTPNNSQNHFSGCVITDRNWIQPQQNQINAFVFGITHYHDIAQLRKINMFIWYIFIDVVLLLYY